MSEDLTPALIREARERIRPHVRVTPVWRGGGGIGRLHGIELWFKCENLQAAGSFKSRGACNAVFSLPASRAERGVVTHSSGNHAAALARAARRRGIPAHIVMPENAPLAKRRAVEREGGLILTCAPTLAAREAACAELAARSGATLVHPYQDPLVMAGQGSAALELIEAVPDLDLILAPIGGGGLLAGTAVAVKSRQPATRVIGVEPAAADDARRSFLAGRVIPVEPRTIADGLRTTVGERNLPILLRHVDGIVTVSEEAIIAAMREIWENLKLVVEPSAAVPYAALLERRIVPAGKTAIILSGGNVDLGRLPWQ